MSQIIGGAETGLLDSSLNLLKRDDRAGKATTDNGSQLLVNVASGNLVYSHKDSFLPSHGADYNLVRTYNSRGVVTDPWDTSDPQWVLSTAITVKTMTDGGQTYYQVTYGDGSLFRYYQDADSGLFVSTDGPDAYETLEVLTDNSGTIVTGFIVTRADQSRLSFNQSGNLTRWEDTNGQYIEYKYQFNRVTQVIDGSGETEHTLNYSYDKYGLRSVTDEQGNVLAKYTYEGGRLSQVMDLEGHVTRYYYTSDGYLSRIELPFDEGTEKRVISFEYASISTTPYPTYPTYPNHPEYPDYPGIFYTYNSTSIRSYLSLYNNFRAEPTYFRELHGYYLELQNYYKELELFYTGPESHSSSKVLSKMTDAEGNVTTFDYNFNLNQVSGDPYNFHRGGATTVTDALGHETTYAFDANGNILLVRDAQDSITSYSYDEDDNLVSFTDRNGNTSTFTYDERGNQLTTTDGAGNTTVYTYTDFNKLKSITEPEGGVTTFDYDPVSQNLVKRTDPSGDVTRFEYDLFGNLNKEIVELTGGGEQVTEYFYDAFGNNIGSTDAEGFTTSASYDHFGNLLKYTDANGGVYRYTYDNDNRLLTLTDPIGRITTNTYDAVGNTISTSTFDRGDGLRTIINVYDRNNLLVSTTDLSEGEGNARTVSRVYDVVGNETSVTDAAGRTTTYAFNGRRELVEIISTTVVGEDGSTPINYSSAFAYDGEGNVISFTDSRGGITQFSYNQNNLLFEQTDANGNVTQYAYDKNSNLISIVAGMQLPLAKRQRTTFVYDDENQLVTKTDAEGNVETYDYDAPGNIVRILDGNGNPTDFEYDLNNRLIRETYAEVYDAVLDANVRHSVEYQFDGNGNEISRTDENGNVTQIAFDAVDRSVQVTDTNGIFTQFVYDDNDNITRITIQGPGEAAEDAQVSTFRYNNFGELLSETDGHGNALASSDTTLYKNLREQLGYARQIADLSEADKDALRALFSNQYSYDKVSNLLTSTDSLGRVTGYEYDTLDRLVLITDAEGGTQRYHYDGNGNLLAEIDPLGRVSTYAYDALNQETEFVDPLGNRTTASYDAFGNLAQTTEGAGGSVPRNTTYRYDLNNRLLQIEEPNGRGESYRYDAVGNRIEVTDARGNTSENQYDARDRLVKVLDPKTFETRFEYDGVGNTINIIDPRDGKTTFNYDPGNRLLSLIDPEGRKTTYAYDARGNQITQTTAAGTTGPGSLGEEVTRFEYDQAGNLRSVVDAEGGLTEFGYDRVYNPTSRTDAEGNTITTQFDVLNRAHIITDAMGATTRFAYDAVGNELEVTDPNGAVTRYQYDVSDQVIRETDALGVVTRYEYDEFGAAVRITEAEGLPEQRTSQFEYDDNGNLKREIDALGGVIDYNYDVNNNAISTVDQNGNITTFDYDANNRVSAIIDHLGGVTSYQYDGNGNRVQVTDANGNTSISYFNANDEIELEVDALGFVIEFEYDANGNVIRTTKYVTPVAVPVDPAIRPALTPAPGSDKTLLLEYDKLNRLVRTTDGEGGIRLLELDSVGNLVKSTDANGNETQFSYDANYRQTQIVDSLGGIQTFTYDTVGNQIGSIDQNNGVRTNQYDVLNRLTKSTDPLGGELTYRYDAVGNLTAETDENGNETHYAYDQLDRLITQTNAKGHSRVYTYDAAGNLVTETDENSNITQYEYDALNRLTRQINPEPGSITYGYDAVGNQTAVTDEEGDLSEFSYDALNRLHVRTDADGGTLELRYDFDGNQIYREDESGVIIQYTWDRNGLILSEQLGSDAPVTYLYDAQGNRTSRSDQLGNTTTYEYDGLNRKIKETDPLGAPQSIHYDAVGNILSVTDQNAGDFYVEYDANDRRVVLLSKEGYLTTFEYDAVGNETRRDEYDDVYTLNGDGSIPIPNPGDTPRTTTARYNELNQVVVITEPDGRITGFEYDAVGNLVTIYDGEPPPAPSALLAAMSSSHVRQRFGHNKNNETVTTTDAAGTVTELTLDKKGNVIKRVAGEGTADERTTTYTYDKLNRLKTETNDLGSTISYTYDKSDRVLNKTTSGPGVADRVEWFEYDPATGRLSAEIDAEGLRKEYSYDQAGNTTEIHYTDGATLLYTESAEYDAKNRLVAETDGEGVRTEYSYDARDNKIETIQAASTAEARVTSYVYDAHDRLTAITNPENGTTRYYYDAQGNQDVIVEANGNVTQNTFDDAGRILTNKVGAGTVVENPDGTASVTYTSARGGILTTNTYDERGNVLSTAVGFADGIDTRTTRYEYDVLDRLIGIIDPEGFASRFEYDVFDNQTRVSIGLYELSPGDAGYDASKAALAFPQVNTFEYDKAGQLIRTTDGEGNVVENTYDAQGNQVTVTVGIAGVTSDDVDHAGTTVYHYDLNGRVVRKESPEGGIVRITRDAQGNQTRVETLQSGSEATGIWSVESYEYDAEGRITKQTDGEGVETRFEFDAFGNTAAIISAAGTLEERRTEFVYDGMNNLIRQKSPMGFISRFEYDSIGNLIKIIDAEDRIRYSFYNEYNQLVAEVDPALFVVSYTHDSAGNVLSVIQHATALAAVPQPGITPIPVTGSDDRSVVQVFDGNNKRISETAEDGSAKLYEYDSAGLLRRQTSKAATDSAKLARTVDSSDRIIQWQWDQAGRLTKFINVDGVEESYTYDAANNQTSIVIHDPNPLATGGFDADRVTLSTYDLNNRLTTETIGSNIQLLDYDKAGNVISKTDGLGHTSITTYDLNNRIKTVTDPESNQIFFAYDVVGNLVSTTDARGNINTLVYDKDNRVIEERGAASQIYTIDEGESTASAVVINRYDDVGNLISRINESGHELSRWYDARGFIVAEVNEDDVFRTYVHNAFGQVTVVSTSRERLDSAVVLTDDTPPPPSAGGMTTITTYYDNLGNAVRSEYPPIEVTALNGAGVAITSSSTTMTLEDNSFYDAWGNLVESTDRAGVRSYGYYDQRDRLIAFVDGGGFLVSTFFDSQGNVVKQVKYSEAVVGVTAGILPTTPVIGDVHTVERFYDQENNLIREVSPEVSTNSGLARATTTFAYDAAGNLKLRTLASGTSQEQKEYYYYDDANRRTAVVSSGGTLATFQYDGNGNLTAQKRYYNWVALTGLDTATTASLVAGVTTSDDDQFITYTYNEVNKLSEQRNHMGSGTTDDIVTTYQYDASLNLTRKVEELDAGTADDIESRMQYDAAGRIILTISPNDSYSFVEYNTYGLKTRAWIGGDPDASAPAAETIGASLSNGADGSFDVSWSFAAGTDTSGLTSWIAWDTVPHVPISSVPSSAPNSGGIYANGSGASTTGTSASIPLADLTAGQTIYYRVVVKDKFGNLSWSAQHTAVVPPSLQNATVEQTAAQDFVVDAYFDSAVTNPELVVGASRLAMTQVSGNHYRISLTGISNPLTYSFAFAWTSGATTYQTNADNLLQANTQPQEIENVDGWMQWTLPTGDVTQVGVDQLIVLNGVVSSEEAFRNGEEVEFEIGTTTATYNYDLYLGNRVTETHDFSVVFTDYQQKFAYNPVYDIFSNETTWDTEWRTDNDGKIQTEVGITLDAVEQGRINGDLMLGYRTAGNDGRFNTTVVMTPSGTDYSSMLDLDESTTYDLKIFYIDNNGNEVIVEWRRIDVPLETNSYAGTEVVAGLNIKPPEPFMDREIGTGIDENGLTRSFEVLALERDGLIQGASGSRSFTEGVFSGPIDDSLLDLSSLASSESGQAGEVTIGLLPDAQKPYYTLIEYNDLGIKTASNENDGIWREYGVDAMGNAVMTRSMGLDRSGRKEPGEAPSPIISYARYDSRGLQTQQVGPVINGQAAITETGYNFAGRIVRIQDPGNAANEARLFEYDGVGNLIAETDARGFQTRHYFDLLGNLVRTVDPIGDTQIFQYTYSGTNAGRLTRSYYQGLETTTNETYQYDAFGRRTVFTKGVFGLTTTAQTIVSYDQNNRIKAVRNGEGDVTEYWYDKRGKQIWVRDANNNYFGRQYNKMGFVTHEFSFTQKPGSLGEAKIWANFQTYQSVITRTLYDIFNQRIAAIDPVGRRKDFTYGDFGRLESADGKTYGYDNFNRLISETGGGKNITRDYDDAGRLLQINDSATSTVTDYTYDLAGNRVTEQLWLDGDLRRNQFYQYNANNQLVGWTDTEPGIFQSISYSVDGNVVSINSDGDTVAYSYDAANRIKSNDGTTYDYDYAGNRIREGSTTYTYNKNGWVKTAVTNIPNLATDPGTGDPLPDNTITQEWDYDAVGNVLERTQDQDIWIYTGIPGGTLFQPSETETNTYDTNYRLTKTVNGPTTTWTTFDKSGRITRTRVRDTGEPGEDDTKNFYYNYNYNSLGQQTRITVSGSDDANGESTSTYDVNGRLTRVLKGNGDGDEDELRKDFFYDNDGRIIQADVLKENGGDPPVALWSTTHYLYALSNPTGEYKSASSPTMNTGIYSVFKTITVGFGDNESAVPESSITQHTVVAGNSLRSLAGQYYGSPDLWFVIAEANGLTGKEALQAGSRLVIPNSAQNAFQTSETHALYKESEIVGSKLPNITVPPPEEDNCALIAAIILIVVVAIVAIVLTVVTVGAAAPAAAAALGFTAGSVGAIIVGVAVGAVIGAAIAFAASVTTQLILVGFGLQDEFDWEAVAADTVAGAFGGAAAGLGAAVSAARTVTTAVKVANVVGQLALEAAGEAASQAIQNDGQIVSPGLVVLAGAGGAIGSLGDFAKRGRVAAEAGGTVATKGVATTGATLGTRAGQALENLNKPLSTVDDVASVARNAGKGRLGVFSDVFKQQFAQITGRKFTQTVSKSADDAAGLSKGKKLVRTFTGVKDNAAQFEYKTVDRLSAIGTSKTARVKSAVNTGLDTLENTSLAKKILGRKTVKLDADRKLIKTVSRVRGEDGKFVKKVIESTEFRQSFLKTSKTARLASSVSAAKESIRGTFNAGLDALENASLAKKLFGRQTIKLDSDRKLVTTVSRVRGINGKFTKQITESTKFRQSFIGTSKTARLANAVSTAKQSIRGTLNSGLDALESTSIGKKLFGSQTVKLDAERKVIKTVRRVRGLDGKFVREVTESTKFRKSFLATSRKAKLSAAASAAKESIRNVYYAGRDALDNNSLLRKITGSNKSVKLDADRKLVKTVKRTRGLDGKFTREVSDSVTFRQSFLGTSRKAKAFKAFQENLNPFKSTAVNPYANSKAREKYAKIAKLVVRKVESDLRASEQQSGKRVETSIYRPSKFTRSGGFDLGFADIAKVGKEVSGDPKDALVAQIRRGDQYTYTEVADDFEAAGDPRSPRDKLADQWNDVNARNTYAEVHASQHNYVVLDWRAVAANTTSGVFSPFPIDRVSPLQALLKSNRMMAGQVAQFDQESIVSNAERSVGGVDGDAANNPGLFT